MFADTRSEAGEEMKRPHIAKPPQTVDAFQLNIELSFGVGYSLASEPQRLPCRSLMRSHVRRVNLGKPRQASTASASSQARLTDRRDLTPRHHGRRRCPVQER